MDIQSLCTLERGNLFTQKRLHSNSILIFSSIPDGNDLVGKNQSITPYRFPVFAIGVLLGFYIKKWKMCELTKVQRIFGWALAVGSVYGIYYNLYLMAALDYKVNTTISAVYSSFAPVVLCLIVGWIIFVSQLGDSSKDSIHSRFDFQLNYLFIIFRLFD